MTLSLQPLRFDFGLQELLLPRTYTFATDQPDLIGCTGVLKVRLKREDVAAVLTLVVPTDIVITSDLKFAVTWTSAHFATLLAAYSAAGVTSAVHDLVFTPISGTPQMGLEGNVVLARTVSR